jgi:hypothetical protein
MNMDKVSTEIEVAHGHDTSLSDASAPVIINLAEKSALAGKALYGTESGAGSNYGISSAAPEAGNFGKGDI